MTNASLGLVLGLALTILTAFGGYVATAEAYCEAEMRRVAQPCPAYWALLERERTHEAEGVPTVEGVGAARFATPTGE